MALLQVENLRRRYAVPQSGTWFGSRSLAAVDGVSFELEAGKTLGIVGESGSGKSTLARMLMALEWPDEGRVLFEGQDLKSLASRELRRQRRHFQMIFQDPSAALDPRQKVWRAIMEPLAEAQGKRLSQLQGEVAPHLAAVGLESHLIQRLPHELSGGQRQRVMIARAVSTRPKLLVADEAVSSLDMTLQAQILDLLIKLKRDLGMAMVFISHDLRLVGRLSDQLAVMRQGQIVEQGNAKSIYADPQHEYTRELLAALPPVPADLLRRLRKEA